MTMLTATRLRELLNYDSETGEFKWKSTRGRIKAGAVAGWVNQFGYVRITFDRGNYAAHRLAWLYVHGEWPSGEIDHINHIKTDNRLANLRQATRIENQGNRSRQRNNKSGFKGVSFRRERGCWIAQIYYHRKRHRLGHFATPEAAAAAYQEAAVKFYGDFAHFDGGKDL